MKMEEDVVSIPSTGAASNAVVQTKNANNNIPQDISKREIVAVHVKDLSGTANTVVIENYDAVDAAVDGEVELEVAANEEETLDIGKVLEIPSKDSDGNEHQLTYSTDGDASLVIRYRDIA